MKRLLFLIFLISSTFHAFSQDNDSPKLAKNYSGALFKGLVIDIGTAYIEDESSLARPDLLNVRTGRPSTINIYFFKRFNIIQEYLTLSPGIGLGLDNFYFENNLVVSPVGDSLFHIDNSPNRDYDKSKISANYIDIPIELQFSTSKDSKKALKLAIGGKFGILFSGKSKVKYEVDDVTIKTKQSGAGLNRFRYGLTARVGYSHFNVFGYYGLSSLFEEEYSHDVNPIIFGLSVTTF